MTKKIQFVTMESLAEMNGSALVGYYNRLAETARELGGDYKEVARFSDSKAAMRRINGVETYLKNVDKDGAEAEVTEPVVVPPVITDPEAAASTNQPEEEQQMAAKKSAKKAKPAKKTGEGAGGPRVKYEDAMTIHIKAKENPRRGEAAKRFELYKEGMTLKQYFAKFEGGRPEGMTHVRWDVKHGFIALKKAAE